MRITILALLALFLGACAQPTVLVTVPPRLDLARYPMLGIVDFVAAPERALGERAARQLVEQVQTAQPGTRFIELGPGSALSGFMKRIDKSAQAFTISDVVSLEETTKAMSA